MRCRQGHDMQPTQIEGIALEFCPVCGAQYLDGEEILRLTAEPQDVAGRRVHALFARMCELHDQARTDPLTGLLNRACFDQFLDHFPTRHHDRLALLVLEIDAPQDPSAPDVDDEVLRVLGERIAHAVRCERGDLAYRIGSCEFAIAALDVDPDQGRAVAERLRRRAAERPYRTASDHSIAVTVSLGLAFFDAGSFVPLRSIFDLASRRLHAAKRSGPNSVASTD